MHALVAVVVLLAVLAVADRVAELIVARKLASRIQSAQHLSARPDVSIGGWPFLTQVLRGRYRDVTISSHAPIGSNGVSVSDARVTLHGVQVDTSDALHGTVVNVPVASGDGTALFTYTELDAVIAKYVPNIGSHLTVVGTTPGHARVQGPFGLALNITANRVAAVPVRRPPGLRGARARGGAPARRGPPLRVPSPRDRTARQS